jgi:hypothetical protein
LTTASSNFSNSGTVTVAKGTTLTVGGTSHSYNQTAGTTTVDGTLSGGTTGSANFTGGSIFGAGTVKANTSVGNATGTAVTINIGDNGKSGLLAITGTYTQLATGTMTGLINGTTAGSGFSQLTVSGTAALAGTINFTVASAFQSSLFAGETFTVLTASSVTGTFSNTTIAINSSFHFTVTYTATGVVLTVATGPSAPPASSPAQPVAQIAASVAKPVAAVSKTAVLTSGVRHRVNGVSKGTSPILVAGITPARSTIGHNPISNLRSWERTPVVSASPVRPVVVAVMPRVSDTSSPRVEMPTTVEPRVATNHQIGIQSPLARWMGSSTNRRTPIKILPPMLPRITR